MKKGVLFLLCATPNILEIYGEIQGLRPMYYFFFNFPSEIMQPKLKNNGEGQHIN